MLNSAVNNSLDAAQSIRLKSAVQTFTSGVDQSQPERLYRFRLGRRSRFDLSLEGLTANASVELGQDRDRNNQLSASEIITSSIRPGRQKENITTELDRGVYHLRVFSDTSAGAATRQTRYALKLSARPIIAISGAGIFQAKYYTNLDFTGAPSMIERLGDIQKNNSLSFVRNWGVASPTDTVTSTTTNITSDLFAAQFTTRQNLAPGLYRVNVKTGDSVRVKIGNQTVLDQWDSSIANVYSDTHSGYFYSDGKAQQITVEYADRGGEAAIDFNLTPIQPLKEKVNRSRYWKATVFAWDDRSNTQPSLNFFEDELDNPNAIGVINLGSNTRFDGRKGLSFNWNFGALKGDSERLPSDRFVMQATTRAEFDGGAYRFWVRGDDGFQLIAKRRGSGKEYFITPSWQWTQAYGSARLISYTLPEGRYNMTVNYYDRREVANLDLYWEKDPTQPAPKPPNSPTSPQTPTNPYPQPTNPYPQPTNPYPQPTNPYPYPQPTNPYPYPQPTNPYPQPPTNSGGSSSGGSMSWDKPLYGYPVTDRFGPRQGGGVGSSSHKGIDIGTGTETPPVEAAAKGTVTYAQTGWNGGFGSLVEIDHGNGILTRYAHLSKISVRQGDRVDTNTVIGNVGSTGSSTGNHLHFEIVVNGEQKNPEEFIYFG